MVARIPLRRDRKPWTAATPAELELITRQLGRTPRNLIGVASRCFRDRPQVVANAWQVKEGANATRFPTLFWLTCPEAVRRVHDLEDHGEVKRFAGRLREDPQFAADLRSAHQAYAVLRGGDPNQGIGGLRDQRQVKCLHMHYAHYLATGQNPIGAWVETQLVLSRSTWACRGCQAQSD